MCVYVCGSVPVRVAVDFGWRAVGRPAGVGDTSVRIENLCQIGLASVDGLLQLGDLSDALESDDLVLLVSIDGQTSRVVATVFESRQTWKRASVR